MGLVDFVNMCKDFFMLILSAISGAVGSLFSMPLFGAISVGQILLAFIAFGVVFGFIFGVIVNKFGSD